MKITTSKAEFSSSEAVEHGLLFGVYGPGLGYVGLFSYQVLIHDLPLGSVELFGVATLFALLPFAYLFGWLPAFLTGYVTSYCLQRFGNPWLLTVMGMTIGAMLAGTGGWVLAFAPDFMAISGGFAGAVVTCCFAIGRLGRDGRLI